MRMDASGYAFVQGVRRTRSTLTAWRAQPWPVLRTWLLGGLAAGSGLLVAIWVIATFTGPGQPTGLLDAPPFAVGQLADVVRLLEHNSLVLALHAMACVAGFIAGSSLPLQGGSHTGWQRAVHERGRPLALGFVFCATGRPGSRRSYACPAIV